MGEFFIGGDARANNFSAPVADGKGKGGPSNVDQVVPAGLFQGEIKGVRVYNKALKPAGHRRQSLYPLRFFKHRCEIDRFARVTPNVEYARHAFRGSFRRGVVDW